jgi:DNA topoisomerase-1
LIWKRALASQMADAKLAQTTALVAAGKDGAATLKATGSQVTFAGFIKAYLEGSDDAPADTENLLPTLSEGDDLKLLEVIPNQHFTQPPPRFTEASLVKTLEEHGIGRPSTYASIISVIQSRGYVRLEERRFFPEEIGLYVSDVLTGEFAKYVDYQFTAYIEEELDEIAAGKKERVPVLTEWWKPFKSNIDSADPTPIFIETGEKCPECKEGKLGKRFGRFGMFIGCSRYPECKYIRPIEKPGEKEELALAEDQAKNLECPECGKAMQARRGPYGVYIACSNYPECKGKRQLVKSTGVACPKCKEGELAERKASKGRMRGKIFYGCSRYPKCDFATWQEPVKEPCPECRSLVTKRGKSKIACTECDWEQAIEPEGKAPAAA